MGKSFYSRYLPTPSMIRVQNRISVGLEVLQFFTMRAWYFKSDNYASLWDMLTDVDRKK